MKLAEHQGRKFLYLTCTREELESLPKTTRIVDFQDGVVLAEFKRDGANTVALRLCGIDIKDTL